MTKRATVLINSFRRKSGVHPMMSPRKIEVGTKFKIPLYKMGELVMAYDVRINNKTLRPRAFLRHTLDQMMVILVTKCSSSQQKR